MAESDPLQLDVDAVLVPRAVLDTIALALAAIVRVSGEGLGVIIDRMDKHDAVLDPDEPTFDFWLTDRLPGDPVDHEDGGDAEEAAWIEWQPRRHPLATQVTCGHEDAEEDDPSGQCDEDGINTDLWASTGYGPGCTISDAGEDGGDTEPNGDEQDGNYKAEDEFCRHDPRWAGPGCPVSDPGGCEEGF